MVWNKWCLMACCDLWKILFQNFFDSWNFNFLNKAQLLVAISYLQFWTEIGLKTALTKNYFIFRAQKKQYIRKAFSSKSSHKVLRRTPLVCFAFHIRNIGVCAVSPFRLPIYLSARFSPSAAGDIVHYVYIWQLAQKLSKRMLWCSFYATIYVRKVI